MNTKTNRNRAIWAGVAVFLAVLTIGVCVQDKSTGSLPSARHKTPWQAAGNSRMPPMPPSESFVQNMMFSRFQGVNSTEVMEFVKKYFPLELHEFRKMAKIKPDDAMDMMTDVIQESLSLMESRKNDPDLFDSIMKQKQLEKKAERQARSSVGTKGEAKEKILKELKQTLQEAFAVRQDLINKDVEYVEEELGKLKELAGKRQTSKDAIIARKISEMTGEKDYLSW